MSKTLLGYIPNKSMNIKLFEYINSDGHTFLFPFRVGDIVKVKDWGGSFSSYKDAFVKLHTILISYIGKTKSMQEKTLENLK